MKFGKKRTEPIIFEVQKDYDQDLHTIHILMQWTERNDALANSGQRTKEDWLKERAYIDGRISELERKYAQSDHMESL